MQRVNRHAGGFYGPVQVVLPKLKVVILSNNLALLGTKWLIWTVGCCCCCWWWWSTGSFATFLFLICAVAFYVRVYMYRYVSSYNMINIYIDTYLYLHLSLPIYIYKYRP